MKNDIADVVAQIRANDKVGVMVFLHHGGDPNARNAMGWTLLHVACFEGKTEMVELLLNNGAQVNSCTTDMRTPLHRAAAQGCKGAVAALLNNKAYVNAQDKFGNTALHEAAKGGFTSICKALIANKADKTKVNLKKHTFRDLVGSQLMGAVECGDTESLSLWLDWDLSPDTVGSMGWSLLHHSAARGQIEVVKMLLKRGANIHVLDCNKTSPLHSACSHGQKDIAKLLIRNGADINAKDQRGNTPLHSAVSGSHAEVINLLLEAEADTSVINDEGYAFHTLAKDVLVNCVHDGKTQQVIGLLRGNADPDTRDTFGTPVLCVAAFKKDLCIVDALLEAGSNPDLPSQDSKKTALHYASFWNDLLIIKSLLDHKAKIDPTDKFGGTPLHEAAREGHVDVITMLTGRRSALNIPDKSGNTALHVAAKNGQTDAVELLLEKGANESLQNKNNLLYSDLALIHAVRCSIPDKVISGLAWGGNPNNRDSKGWSLLHHAVYKEDPNITDLLIECDAEVNLKNDHGRTPLILAAYRGNVEISRKLVEAGGNLDEQDYLGQTALHWGAREGSVDIVLYLIDSGADTSVVDKQGHRFSFWLVKHLYLAVRHSDSEKVDLLLAAGADQNAKVDGTDVTPREEAKRRKCYLILKQLVASASSLNQKIEEEFDFWEMPIIEDLRHLFKGCSDGTESDEDSESDSEAEWKMNNADVVLSAKEVFQEDKEDLWEVWDEKPKWISKKDLDQEDMQNFWDDWEEKPKTLSAKECFRETWLDEENEETASESDSSDENTETLLIEAEKMQQKGKIISAKEFFKEDECWWRDAEDELEKPREVAISANEYFKEDAPWWQKDTEHNGADDTSSSVDNDGTSSEEETDSSSSDGKGIDVSHSAVNVFKKEGAISAQEFFKEDECWWEDAIQEKSKDVISAKDFFKDELPWWQTEDENEFSTNKAIPAKDIFKEDTDWWEDDGNEQNSLTDEAYESIISETSTMYSASEGTSDLFPETESILPSCYNDNYLGLKDTLNDDEVEEEDQSETVEDSDSDDSDEETQAESIVEEEIIETESTTDSISNDDCKPISMDKKVDHDESHSNYDSTDTDELDDLEDSIENVYRDSSFTDKLPDDTDKENVPYSPELSLSESKCVVNKMDVCLAELDAKLAQIDIDMKKSDSYNPVFPSSVGKNCYDSDEIKTVTHNIATMENDDKIEPHHKDKFNVIKVNVRLPETEGLKSSCNNPTHIKSDITEHTAHTHKIINKHKDSVFDELVNNLINDGIGNIQPDISVTEKDRSSETDNSSQKLSDETCDSKESDTQMHEPVFSMTQNIRKSPEDSIDKNTPPIIPNKGIWRCSTYEDISISQYDKMASVFGNKQEFIEGTNAQNSGESSCIDYSKNSFKSTYDSNTQDDLSINVKLPYHTSRKSNSKDSLLNDTRFRSSSNPPGMNNKSTSKLSQNPMGKLATTTPSKTPITISSTNKPVFPFSESSALNASSSTTQFPSTNISKELKVQNNPIQVQNKK